MFICVEQVRGAELDRQEFSAREYCAMKGRRPAIFFTSGDEHSKLAFAPLHRMWLDSIIRGFLSMPEVAGSKAVVRIFMDELYTLGELSSLPEGTARGRKHGIDFCFGFQNVSQGKANYGELWNSIASAPYSKIVMRTGEPEGADHGSKMLGEHNVERLIEHRGQDGTRTYTTQPYNNVRLVTGSDLGDLDNRVGFLRHGKYVTKIKLAIPAWRPDRCEAFVRRTGIAPVQLPMPNLVEIQAKEAADKAKFAQKAASYVYDPNLKPHQTTQQQRGRKKPAANQGPLPFSE